MCKYDEDRHDEHPSFCECLACLKDEIMLAKLDIRSTKYELKEAKEKYKKLITKLKKLRKEARNDTKRIKVSS